ncbi:hypothetical protein DDF62_08690 [Caulobacter radicis]|uniref:restriction endonuclease n=1 Tax=Caulobacter radicis TaxID=2172650 RepID=UPI000D57C79E|nr:restriction endonuclease [Caulobacter radicis]PVM90873.1 hypothetical protein DDF62_08690 [Caulobacter radicis]
MTDVRAVDIMLVDDLFEMSGGYVLDFTDRTFGDFFRHEVKVDIDAARYSLNGNSKAKRLRCFLQSAPREQVLRALLALWEYRNARIRRSGQPDQSAGAHDEFCDLVERLGGARPTPKKPPTPVGSVKPEVDRAKLDALAQDFVGIASLDPQARGYAFERFLKALFDTYGLDARGAFRNVGEQLDGSFELDHETYMVEAKWRNAATDAPDLRNLQAKVEGKAHWGRGLFISMNGFSDVGMIAFKGDRVICMDGLDLYDMLNNGLRLDDVLRAKRRRLAETGAVLARVRDLFTF